MPGLTKSKKRAYKKPFTGMADRHGQINLQIGKENPGAKRTHELFKTPSRKRKGSMEKGIDKWERASKKAWKTSTTIKQYEQALEKAMRGG